MVPSGPAQVKTCDVGPGARGSASERRPVESIAGYNLRRGHPPLSGAGIQAFSMRKPGRKESQGVPPCTPWNKTARWGSLHLLGWWPLERSLSGKSAPDQIWKRIFGEKIFSGYCSVEKSSHRKSQERKFPNQGTYRPRRVPPAAAGGIHSNLFFARTCAGQKTLLSPRVPASPARVGLHPLILGGATNQTGSLTPSYTVLPNEDKAWVPLPKFSLSSYQKPGQMTTRPVVWPVAGRPAPSFLAF